MADWCWTYRLVLPVLAVLFGAHEIIRRSVFPSWPEPLCKPNRNCRQGNVISWLRLSATLKDFWTISFDSPDDFGLFVWRTFMILNYLYHNTDFTLSMNLSTDNSPSSYWWKPFYYNLPPRYYIYMQILANKCSLFLNTMRIESKLCDSRRVFCDWVQLLSTVSLYS